MIRPGDVLRHRVRRRRRLGRSGEARPGRARRRSRQRVRLRRCCRIGIDVGGTFTDLVAVDDAGRVHARQGRLDTAGSIDRRDGRAGPSGRNPRACRRPTCSPQTERIVHGTTVATNALLEHKGAKVGLLTTEGHRDVIEMREGLKDDRYNLRMPPPVPLVPRALRLGVRERMRADGRVETPLDRASLDAAIAALRRRRGRGGRGLLPARLPRSARTNAQPPRRSRRGDARMPTSRCRRDVFPQIKEFDRVSTTVVNAYVGPALSRYLHRLEQRLVEAGYRGPMLIIQSHGGVAPIAEAARLAAGGVLSGPAGGVAGSRYAAQLLGSDNLIPFDMGGTSTDICLIVDGEPALVSGPRRRRTSAGAEQPRHRQPRRRRRFDRPGRCRRHPACRPGKRRRRCPGRPATAAAAPSRR